MLTNSDIIELTELRRQLHRRPEISGEEAETAKSILTELEKLDPSDIVTELGGHGVAGIFDSGVPGKTILFRAELDALPIHEISDNSWRSEVDGKGHLCGHDGHMTMLLAFGRLLKKAPPKSGRVILMFQPAEEDGSGARAVVADPRYERLKPDYAFALHNEPGRPLGYVSVRVGLMNCASQGLQIKFTGKTSHAAEPEAGISPALAIAELIPQFEALSVGTEQDENFRLVTLTHVNIGEDTFGIAPGEGIINVTLRTGFDEGLKSLVKDVKSRVTTVASLHNLQHDYTECDIFAATVNGEEAVNIASSAMTKLTIPHGEYNLPMRASEDFGVFGWNAKAAMLCLGSGEDSPALHNPDFDFPDDLIPIGAGIYDQIMRDVLG